MGQSGIDAWLIYDYRQSNPFFRLVLEPLDMVTRPAFLLIPAKGDPTLLVHNVDIGRFSHIGHRKIEYTSRTSLLACLSQLLSNFDSIAMEYSKMGELPRISRVDGGTLEMVRSLGTEVVSSADLVQYATQRWTSVQLQSHTRTAELLSHIVMEAFEYIGRNLSLMPSELEVGEFILQRMSEEGLYTPDGPVVAVDHHSSDPHHLPTKDTSLPIRSGNWVLIDLWARENHADGIFADITWVAYIGRTIPIHYQNAFNAVIGARDIAFDFLQQTYQDGEYPKGWEVDRVARDYLSSMGYGLYFTHRLGHSLGKEVHGEAVNLDGWETLDTRLVIPKIGVTIEPGIYMPHFGMRSEIDVYMADDGPVATSAVQKEIVLIG